MTPKPLSPGPHLLHQGKQISMTMLESATSATNVYRCGKRHNPHLSFLAPPVAPASPVAAFLCPAARPSIAPVPALLDLHSLFLHLSKTAQKNAQTIEMQASSLKSFVSQLRDAISLIDVQRSEFKGFLDGSKDALDRMEEWAGKAMGLNLRNSPEQVRRYLPLSVMWVANSKLKKVMDGLQQIKKWGGNNR